MSVPFSRVFLHIKVYINLPLSKAEALAIYITLKCLDVKGS